MREISIFADESGDKSNHNRYFILTLVMHDQDDPIAERVSVYEASLRRMDLPNMPFHSEPLLNGHGEYEYLSMEQRKRLLSSSERWSDTFPSATRRSSTGGASSKTPPSSRPG